MRQHKLASDNEPPLINARPHTAWAGTRDPQRRLVIGFVTGDWQEHPVGFFSEGILAALASHHADELELLGYLNQAQTDDTSARIGAHLQACCNVTGMSDQALAARIHADQIDILIDLSGHTAYNRLPVFAWQPAPVQATWLGYFATTGVKAIDWLIADPGWCQV